MEGLDPENPAYEIRTLDQGRDAALAMLERTRQARTACDILIPSPTEALVLSQQKAFQKFLINYGATLGVLGALHRARLLSDEAYLEIRKQTTALCNPTTVGQS